MRFATVSCLSLLLAAACSTPANDGMKNSDTAKVAAAKTPAPDPKSPEGRIASAMTAAPASIAAAATVMDLDSAGKMIELRKGTNGWLCMPDMPNTPGPDPMCADKSWQDWFGAYMAKKPPSVSGVGVAYMLAGGSDASNTDPYATGPAAGNDWISTGAHMMVLPPNPKMLDAYTSDPSGGGPYIMWKGTPYAHLMVPVSMKP